MKVAVLGGGSGAHAMASDLSLAGHEIRMAELAEFADNIVAVQALGGIHLLGTAPMGGSPGFARIHLATTDVSEAVRGADLVMVVVPAYGHEAFMRALIACAEPGQVVVFNSGYFASLVFAKMLADAGRGDDLLIGETASLVYLTRLCGAAQVRIKASKRTMPFSALPASKTPEALRRINTVYPQFVSAQNVLETSMNEAGIIIHPVSTLLNTSRIEQIGPYCSSYYDITPSVGRVMDALDREKQAVQRALGLRRISLPQLLHEFFGSSGANCYEAIRACPNYHTQMTPDSLQFRYITEDVPYGLVPIASIGDLVGVDTSTIRAIIQLAGIASGEDYWQIGRTAERLGLCGMGHKELVRYVYEGNNKDFRKR